MTQHDTTLLQHWATRRDAEAFNEIVTRYVDLVYGTCRRVLGNAADAEDVTQECFIRLAQAPGQVRSSVGGWLHRLATHRSRDLLKAQARRRKREERFADGLPQTEEAEWDDVQALLDEAIEQLPKKQRRVIVAHFLERKTHEGIAGELGVTRPAVSYHVQKGVENLRRFLQKRGVQASVAFLTASTTKMAEAAPAHLASRLGRLALAGTRGSAATGATLLARALAMKKIPIVVAVIGMGALALWALVPRDTPPTSLAEADNGAKPQGPATSQPTNPQQAPSPTGPGPNAAVAAQPDDGGAPAALPEDTRHGEDATTGGTVEGVVVDRYGSPIRDASVFLQRRPEQENPFKNAPVARTARDGAFRVDGVGLNLKVIFADHPDFSPGWTSIRPDPGHVDSVRMTLTTGGTIEGRLTVDGRPASGNVAAALYGVVRTVAVEPSGSYRLERVTPGIVDVIAFVTRHRNMIGTAIVEPGKTALLDFEFPAATSVLEGRVTVDGEAVSGAILTLSVHTASDAYEDYCVATESDGSYRFERLPPGPASMAAYSTQKDRPRRRTSVSFEIASEDVTIQDVDLTAGPCAVSGRIDHPCEACHGAVCIVKGELVLERFTVSALQNLDSLMVAHSYEIGETYRFDGLQPGTYTLLVLLYPDHVDSTSDFMGQAFVATEVVHFDDSQEHVVDLWPSPVAQ